MLLFVVGAPDNPLHDGLCAGQLGDLGTFCHFLYFWQVCYCINRKIWEMERISCNFAILWAYAAMASQGMGLA